MSNWRESLVAYVDDQIHDRRGGVLILSSQARTGKNSVDYANEYRTRYSSVNSQEAVS